MSSVRHIHGITPSPLWLTLPRGPIGDPTANSWPFRGSVLPKRGSAGTNNVTEQPLLPGGQFLGPKIGPEDMPAARKVA
jgi:hypothetical protein